MTGPADVDIKPDLLERARLFEARARDQMRREFDGGRDAIAGFHYQLLSTLLTLVQRFVRDGGATSLPQLEMEFLTDLLSIDNDYLWLTQIKKTQSSSSVQHALGGLWRLYKAAGYDSDFQSRLRFKIQAARSNLKDTETTITNWSKRHRNDSDEPDVADFVRRVDTEVISDPRGDIYTLLLNEMADSDPSNRVDRWLGRLLSASEEGDGFHAGIEAVWNELRLIWTGRESSPVPRGMVLFGPADVPPSTLRSGRFLTGERPKLEHLRNGYFAERPVAFSRAERDFLEWLESRQAADSDDHSTKLPVFWIKGRSGAGKSVLLLQLLSRLHADRTARVLWLANNPQFLPDAIDWVRTAMRDDTGDDADVDIPWVIAIDDPYRVGTAALEMNHWQETLAKVSDMLETGRRHRLPLIICCGPSEQAEKLEEDFGSDIDVCSSLVENETDADYEDLRNWFIARTGITPPAVTERNLLLVQLFFEWSHGGESLEDFAKRFRTRLAAMDQGLQISGRTTMVDLVTRALAVNRLYGGYPVRAVSGLLSWEQRDSLDELLDEEHLQTRVQGRSEALWIAHPHLSNVIYETWFPAVKRGARTGHLLGTIADCEKYGPTVAARMAPLLAISRTVQDKTGDLSGRLDQAVARDALTEAYGNASDSGLSLIGLAYWVEIAASMPAVDWSPDPVATAVERILDISVAPTPTPSPGLRGLCYKLLQYAPAAPGVTAAIIGLLDKMLEWKEAFPIACAALAQLPDTELDSAAYRWVSHLRLEGDGDLTRVGTLLARAMCRSLPDPQLVITAASLVDFAPATRDWRDITLSLLRRGQETHLPVIVSWLSRHLTQGAAVGLLRELLKADVPNSLLWEVIHLGAQWLKQKPMASPSWSFVMGALLERLHEDFPSELTASAEVLERPADQKLDETIALRTEMHALASSWLRGTPGEDPGWAYLFEALWACGGESRALEGMGLDWLRDNPQHRGWAHLWEFLWKIQPGRPELAELGVPWLEEQADHPAWAHVWKALHGLSGPSDWLDQAGRRWLCGHFSYDGWSQVWRALWYSQPDDRDLADLAFTWFRENPGDPFIGTVYTALWSTGAHIDELGEVGIRLLKDQPDSKSWFFIWERLARSPELSRSIRGIVIDWLEVNFNNNKWSDPWERLWKTGEYSNRLFSLALSWLSDQPGQTTWGYVWGNLWKTRNRREEVIRAAIMWLRCGPAGHRAWTHIWGDLWDSADCAEDLTEIGIGWLGLNQGHPGWTRPWETLWKTGRNREELIALGISWLKQSPDDPSWGIPWHAIWDAREKRASLKRIGNKWLPHHLEHRSWPWVWRELWDSKKNPPGYHTNLAAMGVEWMWGNPENLSLSHVFEDIWDARLNVSELTNFALSWLGEHPKHKSWTFIWKKLWRAGPTDTLAEYCRAWLRENPNHKEHKTVQGMLVSASAHGQLSLADSLPLGTFLGEPLSSLGAGTSRRRDSVEDAAVAQVRLIGEAVRDPVDPLPAGSMHFDGPSLPGCKMKWWTPVLDSFSAVAYRAASAATTVDTSRALSEFLRECDSAGFGAPADISPWQYLRLILADEQPDTRNERPEHERNSPFGLLPLPHGALIAFVDVGGGSKFDALFYDPSRQFHVPAPYSVVATAHMGEPRAEGWLSRFLAVLAERGPAPWFPEAADQFAELTGVTPTEARLIIAGLPHLRWKEGSSLSPDVLKMLGLNHNYIGTARNRLVRINSAPLRKTVASLLPANIERLWTEGPDVASAARTWNHLVGPRTAVPESLTIEAKHAVLTSLPADDAIHALLDPTASWLLNRDLSWRISGHQVSSDNKAGFTADVLTGTIAMLAWLAHQLPVGDPIRAKLPAALAAVRNRLANPELMLSLGIKVSLAAIREALGSPTETGEGFEGYGAIVIPTRGQYSVPAVRASMLDEITSDHLLPALRPNAHIPFPVEIALRLAHAPCFEAALADPGDPVGGDRDADGTWSPQDPARSVPGLVGDVAAEYELSADGAALYLMLLAMPDPTDRNVAWWTGWNSRRLAATSAELTSTDLVIQASRPRAERSLFLPGDWTALKEPHRPLEQWKLPLFDDLVTDNTPAFYVIVPTIPAVSLYERAWQRVEEDNGPGFADFG